MLPINVLDWNVLLVDDEPDNLSVLELLLAYYNARVVSARSGQEALKLLGEQSFTLALVDIQMPGVSGWDVIKHIRENQDPKVNGMLVVAVTAYAMAGDRERVLNAGFDGYVAKPIDVTTFMPTLQETLAARLPQSSPPKPTTDSQEAAPVNDAVEAAEATPSLAIQDPKPSIAGEKHDR
jgi:CheY-like chemotaxis protein